MTWGFPLVVKRKSGQPLKPKPVNNTPANKLDSFIAVQLSGAALPVRARIGPADPD